MTADIGLARAAVERRFTDPEILGDTPSPGPDDRGVARDLRIRERPSKRRLAGLLKRPGLVLALLFVGFSIATAFVPRIFSPHSPTATNPAAVLTPPSLDHWFGTDQLGRDLWARMVDGSSLTIQATLIAVGIALVAGLALGVVAGTVGGAVDAVLMRVVDVQLAIPKLLLALALVTAIGFGTIPVAIAVGIGIIPGFARTTRAEALRVRRLPFVEAARVGGARWPTIVLRHVLPNSWGPVIVLAVLDFGAAIIAIAGLSFLGFGAQPPASEWGSLIADGRAYLITAPWVSLLPGLFVALVVFSLNHIARAIEEVGR